MVIRSEEEKADLFCPVVVGFKGEIRWRVTIDIPHSTFTHFRDSHPEAHDLNGVYCGDYSISNRRQYIMVNKVHDVRGGMEHGFNNLSDDVI